MYIHALKTESITRKLLAKVLDAGSCFNLDIENSKLGSD